MILLADDDRAARVLLRLALEPLGRPVREVSTGQAALAALQGPEPVELLLLDWSLPGLHGREVLQALRGDPRHRNLAVVVVSTSENLRDRDEAAGLGIQGWVWKDPDFDRFCASLMDTLASLPGMANGTLVDR